MKAARRLTSYPVNTRIIPTKFEPGNGHCSLPIIIARMANRFGRTNYQDVMAGSVLVSIPPLIVFLIFQKNFVRGIALTGLKG